MQLAYAIPQTKRPSAEHACQLPSFVQESAGSISERKLNRDDSQLRINCSVPSLAPKSNMQDELQYWLHSVSVVVTAEFHNPSILNPDFLKSQRIVPTDWEPSVPITTPQFSNILFHNGIGWTVDQSKLTVTENCESEFRESYRVYDLVVSYVEKLPHVPYRSLGLNCVVAVRKDDPQQWLTKQYLKDGIWLHDKPAALSMIPKFTFQAGDGALCHLSLDAGQSKLGGQQPVPAVIANCNVHHQGPLDSEALYDAIGRWPQRQEFVIAALGRLLGSAQP